MEPVTSTATEATHRLMDYGAIGVIAVIVIIAFGALLYWVLRKNDEREQRLGKEMDEREQRLNKIITDQSDVITRQSAALESQSTALNRITDRLGELSNCIQRIEKSIDKRIP